MGLGIEMPDKTTMAKLVWIAHFCFASLLVTQQLQKSRTCPYVWVTEDRTHHAAEAEAASPSACRQILRRQACVLPEHADATIVVRMRLGSQRLTLIQQRGPSHVSS